MNEKALFKLGYGLYVLTAQDEAGRDNGCIINTAVQITSTPPAVSVTVNKGNLTHDLIRDTGVFNLSILTEEAPFALFRHFGFQSGREVDKFAGEAFAVGRAENGLPYLSRYVNAYLACKLRATVDLGTHTMFLADMAGGEVLSEIPSMTYAFYHANVKPKPDGAKKGWRCKICGYVYEGDPLPADFICPICKHGAADFEKIG